MRNNWRNVFVSLDVSWRVTFNQFMVAVEKEYFLENVLYNFILTNRYKVLTVTINGINYNKSYLTLTKTDWHVPLLHMYCNKRELSRLISGVKKANSNLIKFFDKCYSILKLWIYQTNWLRKSKNINADKRLPTWSISVSRLDKV